MTTATKDRTCPHCHSRNGLMELSDGDKSCFYCGYRGNTGQSDTYQGYINLIKAISSKRGKNIR